MLLWNIPSTGWGSLTITFPCYSVPADLGLTCSLPGTAASETFLHSIFISLPSSPCTSCCFQGSYLWQILLYLPGTKSTPACALHDQTAANQQCSQDNSATEGEASCCQNKASLWVSWFRKKLIKTECNLIPPQMICGLLNTVRIKTNDFSFTCSFASPQRYRCPFHSQSLGDKV